MCNNKGVVMTTELDWLLCAPFCREHRTLCKPQSASYFLTLKLDSCYFFLLLFFIIVDYILETLCRACVKFQSQGEMCGKGNE